MNKLNLYAIWDTETKVFDNPWFAPSDLFAKRRFHLMTTESKTLKTWPQQFELWRIVNFDLELDPNEYIKKQLEENKITEDSLKYIGNAKTLVEEQLSLLDELVEERK